MTTLPNDDFAGAVLILSDTSRADQIASKVISSYFNDTEDYHYTVTESTPMDVPENLRDLTTAKQIGMGGQTSVLTVYPWAERKQNGKIPR